MRLGGGGAYFHRALKGFEGVRVIVAIPICQAKLDIELGIVSMLFYLILNLADRYGRTLT